MRLRTHGFYLARAHLCTTALIPELTATGKSSRSNAQWLTRQKTSKNIIQAVTNGTHLPYYGKHISTERNRTKRYVYFIFFPLPHIFLVSHPLFWSRIRQQFHQLRFQGLAKNEPPLRNGNNRRSIFVNKQSHFRNKLPCGLPNHRKHDNRRNILS